MFLVLYRLPFDTPAGWRRERASVHLTNLALACTLGALVAVFGIRAVAAVQLPIISIAAIAGVWLFSVQHRFEEAQWTRADRWNPVQASLDVSSYLKLPLVLQWFSGSIGFHRPSTVVARAELALARLSSRDPGTRTSDDAQAA